mgnify:CR=1 FL=1
MATFDQQKRPQGYAAITPYLLVDNASATMEFLKQVFEAKVTSENRLANGKIRHAELQIDDTKLMLADTTEAFPAMPSMLYVYVADVDATNQKALAHGAKAITAPENEEYGDRTAGVKDPCGNQWWFASKIRSES